MKDKTVIWTLIAIWFVITTLATIVTWWMVTYAQ